ncbi:MAG: cell filamentation protein Fic [Piscirickettsiaceae bacterium]|nr:MAG: cell filamentation protein Fic [Piscirickettsiaceae bacterium]
MSYQPPFVITAKILSLVEEITRLVTQLTFHNPQPISPLLRKENQIKTLAGTLAIEGNMLGEEKITAVLEGKRVLATVVELAEVKGAINAYQNLQNFRFDALDDCLQAHHMLMQEVLKEAGQFRCSDVGVGQHVAPPFSRVPTLMDDLFHWLKHSDDSLLIKSCVFHYEFEFIHPFVDGNGRMGRLWHSVILNQWNGIFAYLPTESIIREHQQAYYNALEQANDAGESAPFIAFTLAVILQALKNIPNNDLKNVPKVPALERQLMLLALVKNDRKITVVALAKALSCTEKTIKRDLETLKSNHKIKRIGSARAGYWELIE